MAESTSKQKMMTAAVQLFNAEGYDRISVRDISARAGVNQALISYYFGGKKGLLEHLMTAFYEGYIADIELVLESYDEQPAKNMLLDLIDTALDYQQKNVQLSRLAHREVTFDSTLVRELMMSYLMREKYSYEAIFKAGVARGEFYRYPADLFVLQLRDLLIMPYLHPQYIREVYNLAPEETYFKKRYNRYLARWVDTYVCSGRVVDDYENNIIAQA